MTMTAEPITAETTNKNAGIIASLREVADYLEQHPEFPQIPSGPYLSTWLYSKEELVNTIRSFPGPWDKQFSDSLFTASHAIGTGSLNLVLMRDLVCTKRIVKKTLPALPARPALPETTIDEVVWDCPKSILAPHEAPVEASHV